MAVRNLAVAHLGITSTDEHIIFHIGRFKKMCFPLHFTHIICFVIRTKAFNKTP